ncbi:zf-HC2 domain-containing protein [Nocardia salmonicida]|uniref:zf-HC2 domain-containing protein n=1 Tax=Nocardia salmonicida TaxID=53431 RepID=UPI0007A52D04|nr:zf-HC2 domain-containing protein [Nocardia salmonicida]
MSNHSTECGEISELLGAYALGALEEDGAARVAEHLTRCAPCRSERDDLTEVVELLARARPFVSGFR